MQQFELIMKSEELFAREVALSVVVTRPLKSWLYLIPGMFIVDFLRRQRSIRQYTNYYMFPRKMALYAAKAAIEGADSEKIRAQIGSELESWIASEGDVRKDLVDLHMRVIEILITHYQKLLAAEGTTYVHLLRGAYKDKVALEMVLNRLNEMERDKDRCMPGFVMDDYQKRHFNAIQSQVASRRARLVDAVF
jgi:hypothetical protein